MGSEGYKMKDYGKPMKRYVQTMSLRDNPELVKLYREAHDEEHSWPEVLAGIRTVGIEEMEIYICGTVLVMIVEAPEDFDWQSAMDRLGTLPRQAEWENHVAQFQDCSEGQRSDEKWHMMERMFHLYDK